LRTERILFALAAITLHLQFATIAGFPLTVGAILGFLILFKLHVITLNHSASILATSTVFAYAAVLFLTNNLNLDATSFLSSLALSVVAVFTLVSASRTSVETTNLTGIADGARDALLAIAAISILQTLFGMAGSTAFFNPWGTFQFLYEYQPYLQFNPVPRAQGFYLEPSYNAFVGGSLFVLSRFSRRHQLLSIVAVSAILLTARSATAIALAVTLAAVAIASSRAGRVPLIVAFSAIALLAGDELFARISSITEVGSSGNFRVLAPLAVIGDILSSSPFGLPFGSISTVVSNYGLLNGTRAGTSLDNGLYVIVYYFGWCGIGIVLFLLYSAVRVHGRLVRSNSPIQSLTPLWLFGSLLFSGGIVSPEYVFLASMLLIACRTSTASVREKQRREGLHLV
jgi:putative colanic acid polymerase